MQQAELTIYPTFYGFVLWKLYAACLALSGRNSYGLSRTAEGEVMGEGKEEKQAIAGILNMYVHHARNIHNICIYGNQDVYARFFLTHSPEEALSTRIVKGGGRNPDFNEEMQIKIWRHDAVLKCEIWMWSRVRNYLEDQLLGFAMVPLSTVAGKGKLTQDFMLSSTDLFHSPAGTIRLTLLYHGSLPFNGLGAPLAWSPQSLGSEVVLLDHGTDDLEPADYGKIEFPDVDVARENQQMVSEYLNMISNSMKPENFPERHLMATGHGEFSANGNNGCGELKDASSAKEEDRGSSSETRWTEAFTAPLVSVNLEPEQTVVQQNIVDMYMKSVQQFTEPLAKMKLPMDVEDKESEDSSDSQSNQKKIETGKEDGSRVYYGSGAFF